MMFCFTIIKAESVVITIEGRKVENGSIVDCHNVIDNSYEVNGVVCPTFLIDPEVYISSSKEKMVSVTVTNTTVSELENVPSISFCWTTICEIIPRTESAEKIDMVSAVPSPLLIDTMWSYDIPDKFVVSCKIDIHELGETSEVFSFNLNMIFDPEKNNGIDTVNEEDSHICYYDLTGRLIENPIKGQILIKRCGMNASKIIY